MPGPGDAFPRGCEAVDRDEQRIDALRQGGIDLGGDGGMVGAMEPREAPLALDLVNAGIARNDGAVREAHDQRRVVSTSVGIDQEPRKRGHKRRTAEPESKAARHRLDPDIIGDMALELLWRQSEGG